MNALLNAMLWILGASLLGFGISLVFSGWLNLSRRVFLVPYISLSTVFLIWFFRANEIDLPALLSENWMWGVIAGGIVGGFMVMNIRSQPASRKSTGGELAVNLTWLGLAYGLTDALFLNVMPVLAVRGGVIQGGMPGSWLGSIGVGVLALFASLLVTLTYHLGYPEFRNRSVGLVLFGNTLITLAYLLSNNPLGAILSHVIMHIAATMRGPETTIQLPPHTRQVA
jgi:hypothetical protein